MEVFIKIVPRFVILFSVLDFSWYFTAGQVYMRGGRSRHFWPQLWRGRSARTPFFWRRPQYADYVQNTYPRRQSQFTTPSIFENPYDSTTQSSNPINVPTPRDHIYNPPTSSDYNYNSPKSRGSKTKSPTSRDNKNNAPTSSDYNYNSPNSRDSKNNPPTSRDYKYNSPTSRKKYNSPTSHDNIYKSLPSRDNIYKSPSSRDNIYKSPTSRDTLIREPGSHDNPSDSINKATPASNLSEPNHRTRDGFIRSLLSDIINPQNPKRDDKSSKHSWKMQASTVRPRSAHSRSVVRSRERTFDSNTDLPKFSEARSNLSRAVEDEKQRILRLLSRATRGDAWAASELSTLDLSTMVNYVSHNQQLAEIICRACVYTKTPETCRLRFCVFDRRNSTT